MKYLFANWKNALTIDESVALAQQVVQLTIPPDVCLVLFPNAAALSQVKEAVGGKIVLGGQDLDAVRNFQGTYVLIGHSDRRKAGDTDEIVAEKMKKAVAAGIIPVLCVGETKEVASALRGLAPSEFFIAYEPVWAVGTGKNAPAEMVNEARIVIDSIISQILPETTWHFIYGGSVNAENVASYTHLPSVPGVLVGGASTTLESLRGVLGAL